MKRTVLCILLAALFLLPAGAAERQYRQASRAEARRVPDGEAGCILLDAHTEEGRDMKLRIGETVVPVTWEENASVAALRELLPLEIRLSMYGGFEQVGAIGADLPRSDEQTTTVPGDIVLYSGDQIVVFYGSNAWAYTRLGHVDLPEAEMAALLGRDDVTITLFAE